MTVTAPPFLPLESGDHLTRAEFHRRYCARPDIKKAELVEGVVYVASPVRAKWHGEPHLAVVTWLGVYAAQTPGVRGADNATVFLDAHNEVQPDAFLYYEPARASGARMDEKGYIHGAPQLVVEVSASSASYDLHDKMNAYRRNGVLEYIAWQMLEGRIDWFRLREGEYVRVEPDANGMIESEAFPGLRLHVAKMLAGDLAGVLAAMAIHPGRAPDQEPDQQ